MTSPDAATIPGANSRPPVSIFMFVRNGAPTLRRAIDSVLAQTYPNIEFIVQDGASTDGTLAILRSYGERLKVVSEPDDGPSDGLWRALNRCTGDFIGSCLADEELLPDAVQRAVSIFQAEPDIGAVTGDAMITDLQGRQTGLWTSGPFNLVDYLLADYSPYFCASFFRREALLAAGLETETWTAECIEFELWCRLASHSTIKYLPGILAKYATHPDQSSNKPGDTLVHMTGRLKHIVGMCGAGGFVGDDPLMCVLSIWGHARVFCNHALQVGRPQTAEAIYRLIQQTLAGLPKALVDGIAYNENRGPPPPATGLWARLSARWRKPAAADEAERARVKALLRFPPAPDAGLKGRMYARLALRYEARGRLEDAIAMWRSAAALNGLVDRADLPGGALPPIGYTHVAD